MLKFLVSLAILFSSFCYQERRSLLHYVPLLSQSEPQNEVYIYFSPNTYSIQIGSYVELKPIRKGPIVSCTSSIPLPLGLNLSSDCSILGTAMALSPPQNYILTTKFSNSQEKLASINISVDTYSTPPPPANPSISFNSASSSANENVGTTTIPVSLSHPAPQTITVNYAVTGGTATGGGVDYTLANGTLTFNVGDTTQNINVTINNDSLAETNETIIITLSSPTNATLGAIVNHTLTILDDEVVTVSFTIAGAILPESAGTQTYYVALNMSSPLTVTVNYSARGGTATSGSDYTFTGGTLTFNPRETSKPINLTIINDSPTEPDETIIISLSSPTNATLGANPSITITIKDNDVPAPVLKWTFDGTLDPTIGTATLSVSGTTSYGLGYNGSANGSLVFDGSTYYNIIGVLPGTLQNKTPPWAVLPFGFILPLAGILPKQS